MIWLTRSDGEQFMLNDDHILYVEVPHDTILVLTNGDRLRVLESAGEIAERVMHWRQKIQGLGLLGELGIEGAGGED